MSSSSTTQLRAGAVLWFASLQYYAVQLFAAAGWDKAAGYSWARNTISDLANTHCGPYGSRLVCSPSHTLMNASFMLLGATMISGAVLLYKSGARQRLTTFGFSAMICSGIGSVLVGLYPENVASLPHILGAALAFILGNIGIIALGLGWKQLPPSLRNYSVVSGLVGLAALALLVAEVYAGLGIGGMERFAAYPQSIWMIVVGAYLLCFSRAGSRDS